MEEPRDEVLMKEIQKGDKKAFAGLVQKYQNPLYRFFLQMGQASPDAEDLVQETFLRLFKSAGQYKSQGKFRSYLYTLARHTWIDRLRKSTPEESHDLEDYPGPSEESSAVDLQEALDQLSEKLKTTLVLKIYHGLKYEDIGRILDIPVGTVKSRIFLAMEELRKILSGDFEQEENPGHESL